MSLELPPLPDDLVWGSAGYHTVVGQMHDYAKLAVREALERAASRMDYYDDIEILRAMIEEYK